VTRELRRGLALLRGVVLGLLPWVVQQAAAPPPERVRHEAHFGETVEAQNLRALRVPHRWAGDCGTCRTVWYRFDLQMDEPPRDAQVVWLPAASRNAALYLNGRLLAQGGRFSEPMARLGTRSLWAAAPVNAWNNGENRLYVLVKADPARAGFIAAPVIGAESELAWAYRVRSLWGQMLPMLVATAAAIIALVMGLLWFYRRHEAGYAALALACGAFAVQAGSALVAEPPWPSLAWDAWLALLALAVAGLALLLAMRLAGVAPTRRAQLAGTSVLALLAAASAADASGALNACVEPFAAVLIAASGAVLAASSWRRRAAPLLACGCALVLLGLSDALRPLLEPGTLPAQPWAMAVLFGAASWMLLLRFVETLNAVELLNIDLEALVQARTAELQQQFERVADLQRRQTLADERERLMRDMHDGVGGHLVSILSMIEADRRRPGELATAVRDALDDMRLMVDSLEPVDDDLNAVLAMFRDRLAPRLRAAGVTLHWDVELLPAVHGLTPARVLHVLRILQEAVTNALRHGRCTTLWLAASSDAGAVRIRLRDDGCGFDPQAAVPGRGLANMQRRAQLAALTLAMASAPGQGASLELTVFSPGQGGAALAR
jgi:signal transduction histidine kinase